MAAIGIAVTGIPASAFYLEEYEDGITAEMLAEATSENKGNADTADGEVYALSELKRKRESNVKHYRMSDGSITAAVYPYDVQ